jgi:hypothetical protein
MYKSPDLRLSRWLFIARVGFIQSVEGIKIKDGGFPPKNCFENLHVFKHHKTLCAVYSLTTYFNHWYTQSITGTLLVASLTFHIWTNSILSKVHPFTFLQEQLCKSHMLSCFICLKTVCISSPQRVSSLAIEVQTSSGFMLAKWK